MLRHPFFFSADVDKLASDDDHQSDTFAGRLQIDKRLCGSTMGTPSTSSDLVKYLPGSCRDTVSS